MCLVGKHYCKPYIMCLMEVFSQEIQCVFTKVEGPNLDDSKMHRLVSYIEVRGSEWVSHLVLQCVILGWYVFFMILL